MIQSEHVILIWMHRGKVETESVLWYEGAQRARQLQGCTATTIYRISAILKQLQIYTGDHWATTKDAPDEIKLAAMLL